MSEREKQVADQFVAAVNSLPDEQRQYLLGLSDGLAMAQSKKSEADDSK